MAKKEISGYVKLQINGGQANPAPPVGPALGQRGLNIMDFCKAFNDKTKDVEKGAPIPVIITAYKDRSFDLITVGFGLRNFTDKKKGLSEMRRCLSKNGKLMVLEFSKPINPVFSKIYDWYSFNILPKLGSMLANDSESYQYLAESIRMHPDQESLKKIIIESGFNECKFYNLLNGIVAIHIAYDD